MHRPYRTSFASRRLAGWDYSGTARYLITLATAGRIPRFGSILVGKVQLSREGRIVEEEWQRASTLRPGVHLDEFVVMPDHFHAIVFLPGGGGGPQSTGTVSPVTRTPRSLGSLVAQFKATSTARIHREGGEPGKVWQRNYHDRIIRSVAALRRIRQYIWENPTSWSSS